MSCETDGITYDIPNLFQGANYSVGLIIRNLAGVATNITGYTFEGEIRSQPDDTVVANFVFTITNAIAGQVSMTLSAVTTEALTPGPYVYDVKMTRTDGFVIRILQGQCPVIAEVTQ